MRSTTFAWLTLLALLAACGGSEDDEAPCNEPQPQARGQWHALGPNGASTQGLAQDPQRPEVLFVATDGSGVLRSAHSGRCWESRNTGLENLNLRSVRLDPRQPQHLVVATSQRMASSQDAGRSWTPLGEVDEYGYQDVVFDPRSTQTLYALGLASILKSLDGSHFNPVAGGGLAQVFWTIVPDPTQADVVYLGASPRRGPNGGVWKSTDGGRNWVFSGLTQHNVYTIRFDPSAPRRLYAASSAGVFRSDDAAATWASVSTGLPPVDDPVFSLALDPTRPQVLYAGTLFSGVYRTEDAGAHWTPLPGLQGHWIDDLLIDADDPDRIYAGTRDSGVHLWLQ